MTARDPSKSFSLATETRNKRQRRPGIQYTYRHGGLAVFRRKTTKPVVLYNRSDEMKAEFCEQFVGSVVVAALVSQGCFATWEETKE